MIPAILSAVFVVYLYLSLKETPELPAEESPHDSSETSTTELVARLKSLQSRVDQLASIQQQNQGDRT